MSAPRSNAANGDDNGGRRSRRDPIDPSASRSPRSPDTDLLERQSQAAYLRSHDGGNGLGNMNNGYDAESTPDTGDHFSSRGGQQYRWRHRQRGRAGATGGGTAAIPQFPAFSRNNEGPPLLEESGLVSGSRLRRQSSQDTRRARQNVLSSLRIHQRLD